MDRSLLFALLLPSLTAPEVLAHSRGEAALEFHLNKGQWPNQVLYRARTPGGAVFVERNAFTYVLGSGGEREGHGRPGHTVQPLRMHAFKVHFEGGSATGHSGLEPMPHYVNYFLGDDPAAWASGVPAFTGVDLQAIYPGIGLRIDGHGGLKYDWLVAAGADPVKIVMRYEGQDKIEVRGGLLYVHTTAGMVVEQRPVAWQVVHGTQRPVECNYVLDGDRVRFELPYGHDPRYPLVIDPVVVFSSYSGSTGDNFGFTATYDATGHLYGGGIVFAAGYPTTTGALDISFNGGTTDFGISKWAPNGSTLIWSTYIGGSANEAPHSMVVNSSDELYILGTSNSTDFPTTAGCWDNSFNGGTTPTFAGTSYGFTYTGGSDIVVVHLNNTATALLGSTFVGGSGNDGLNEFVPTSRNYGDPFRGEIILDNEEWPLMATSTSSADLFTSPGAPQAANAGGAEGYIFRMDPSLSTMLWATYCGGSGTDAAFGIQVSSTGEIYVTGGTISTDLPMVGNPASAIHSGGVDGFIMRYHPTGAPLLSSTYLGTVGFDQSYFVQLNTADEVFVVGQTTGPYPVTPGKYANPNATQFIHKFSNDLSQSQWSTRIGGAGNENISPSAFLVSNCGQIYFSGWGGSTNQFGSGGIFSSTNGLPTTPDAFQSTTNGSDFYLMMLEPEAISLGYATFFGGTSAEHVDGGTSRFDKNGIVYQAVCAGCGQLSYPTTPGVWSSTNNSTNCNLGVFKMDFEQAVQVAIEVNTTGLIGCLGTPFSFTATGTANSWTWDFGDSTPSVAGAQVTHLYGSVGSYTVTLIGIDTEACNFSDTAQVQVTIVEPPVLEALFETEPESDCQGSSVEFFNLSTNGMSYLWNFGDGGTSTQTNPVHPYPGPGSYEVVLTVTDPLCGVQATSQQTVVLDPPILEVDLASPVALCDGGAAQLNAGPGFDTYLWSTGATGPVITVVQPGIYWVDLTDGICAGSDTIIVVMQPPPMPALDVVTCPGEQALLTPPYPVNSILWSTGATTTSIEATLDGTYSFIAVDVLGCTVRDTIEVLHITTSGSDVKIPNVFSPNGDGMNDSFRVIGDYLEQYNMEIYNRWGQVIYSGTNPAVGWNGGLDNSSNKVPDGTYYYIISFKDRCSSQPAKTEAGHVTLLR